MSDTNPSLPIWALIASVVIGGAFYVAGKNIEADAVEAPTEHSSITVSGDGRVFVVPDIAELTLGFQTGREKTAAAAMEKLKTATDAIIAAVKAEGIVEKDIRTESFWLNPVYDYTTSGQIPRGFEASQSIRVKVRDLDKVSNVLGAGTAGGANQSGGVQFIVDNPEAKRTEARDEAIQEAKTKAQVLARQLGVSLGDIIGFSEGYNGGVIPPMYYSRDMGVTGAVMEEQEKAAVDLPPGEQEVNVTVNITYEID